MQAIMLTGKDGTAPNDPKSDGHDHPTGYRCLSPFLGLWVASGVVALAIVGWLAIKSLLG